MHMSPFRDSFLSFKEIRRVPVKVSNNNVVYATGMDSILNHHAVGDQTVNIILNDVLYIPNLSNNLFSTSNCMKHNIDVIFSDNLVVLKGKNSQVVGVGVMGGSGIFRLLLAPEQQTNHSAMVARSQLADIGLWHDQLGLISLDCIHMLGNDPGTSVLLKKGDSDTQNCAACADGKQRKKGPSKEPASRSMELLGCVHVNV